MLIIYCKVSNLRCNPLENILIDIFGSVDKLFKIFFIKTFF